MYANREDIRTISVFLAANLTYTLSLVPAFAVCTSPLQLPHRPPRRASNPHPPPPIVCDGEHSICPPRVISIPTLALISAWHLDGQAQPSSTLLHTLLQESLSHISRTTPFFCHPCRLGKSRGLRQPLPRRLPRVSSSLLPLPVSRAPPIRRAGICTPCPDTAPTFPSTRSQQSRHPHRFPNSPCEPPRPKGFRARLHPRRRRAVAKAIDLVSLRIDCVCRTCHFDCSLV